MPELRSPIAKLPRPAAAGVARLPDDTRALVGELRSQMLESDECVMVFPEGARGANKPYRKRYQLQPFGAGFGRQAAEPALSCTSGSRSTSRAMRTTRTR